jgi:hypothetical protein
MQACRASAPALASNGFAWSQCAGCKRIERQPLSRLLLRHWRYARCHLLASPNNLAVAVPSSRQYVQAKGERRTLCRAGSSVVDTSVSKAESALASRPDPPGWGAFCEKVSGEWEGYEVTFAPSSGSSWADYTAVELPYEVVPEAFREWEIRIFDWQTQCSSLGNKEDGSVFFR